MPLETHARVRLIAAYGGTAVAIYDLPAPRLGEGEPYRQALLDLEEGLVLATSTFCGARDRVTGLAVERQANGPVAYVSLWTPSFPVEGQHVPASARILALNAETGAVLDTMPVTGLPRPAVLGGSLLLAPGPGGRRLYHVTAVPATTWGQWTEREYLSNFWMSGEWRVQRLNPATLEPDGQVSLTSAPISLAVTPDGTHAYAVDGRPSTASGTRVLQMDLVHGRATAAAGVPGAGGLAVTGERLYVPDPERSTVWVVDLYRQRVLNAIRVGRAPTAIASAS